MVLLHKPVGYDAITGRKVAAGLVQPETRWPDDPSGVRLLERHFHRLTPLVPLDADASGLMVLSQDGRVWRRLTEDRDEIEQELVVSEEHTSELQSLMRIADAVICLKK